MHSALTKYKIGLAIIMAFAVFLCVWLLIQAGATKADKQTHEDASKVAEELSSYITRHDIIPASLQAAGIDDVPEAVSYKKLSSEKYKFCVTYRTESSGFSSSGLDAVVGTALYGSADYGYEYEREEESDYLYIDSSHTKGENCQTIAPYLFGNSDDMYDDTPSGDASTCVYDYNVTDLEQETTDYYACVDKEDKQGAAASGDIRIQ